MISAAPTPLAAPADADAAALVDGLIATVDRLEQLLRDETALIRAARLGEAARMVDAKMTVAGAYQRELEAVNAAAAVIARRLPDRAAALRQRIAGLTQTLTLNLAVVGTAKAVAEDMIRSVAEDVGRRNRPLGYGATGSAGARAAAAPVSVFRQC